MVPPPCGPIAKHLMHTYIMALINCTVSILSPPQVYELLEGEGAVFHLYIPSDLNMYTNVY